MRELAFKLSSWHKALIVLLSKSDGKVARKVFRIQENVAAILLTSCDYISK